MSSVPVEQHAPASTDPDGKGLKSGAIGLVSSIVVGVASTAPAYSLASALGLVVVAGTASQIVGVHAPGVILLAFVPMFLISVAYQQLNKAEPDCGTTFTWATRAFGSVSGWLGGWGIIAADVIVMSNLAQVAGNYSFSFVGLLFRDDNIAAIAGNGIPGLPSALTWGTLAGLAWIAIMTWICYRGIELAARLQYALLSIEVVVLIGFAVFALVRVATGTAEHYSVSPTLDWFNPFAVDFGQVLAPAMLSALFIYWGWDSAVSVNEETTDPEKTPGRAAVVSTLLLLATYGLVSVAAVSFAGVGDKGIGLGNSDNSADVFSAISPQLFGSSPIGVILQMLLAASILTSASASTQTTILPTARTALSMAVYKAIPSKFARIHKHHLTPTWSTIGMGLVSAFSYVAFTMVGPNLVNALIGSIGLMIAFYYGLTGFACAWFYRAHLLRSARDFFVKGLLPLLGGVMLAIVFVYGLIQFAKPENLLDAKGKDVTIFGIGAVAVVGVVALLVGVVLMLVWWVINPDFFRGLTLPRRSADLVLEGAPGRVPAFGLPDSGVQASVVAPDLFNLPTGQIAIDAEEKAQEELDTDEPPAPVR